MITWLAFAKLKNATRGYEDTVHGGIISTYFSDHEINESDIYGEMYTLENDIPDTIIF